MPNQSRHSAMSNAVNSVTLSWFCHAPILLSLPVSRSSYLPFADQNLLCAQGTDHVSPFWQTQEGPSRSLSALFLVCVAATIHLGSDVAVFANLANLATEVFHSTDYIWINVLELLQQARPKVKDVDGRPEAGHLLCKLLIVV